VREYDAKFKEFCKQVSSPMVKVSPRKIEDFEDATQICLTWEANLRNDKYLNNGGIMNLSEQYYKDVEATITELFGVKTHWNNSGHIGWIFISKREYGGIK